IGMMEKWPFDTHNQTHRPLSLPAGRQGYKKMNNFTVMKKILTLILITSGIFASAQGKRKAPIKYWEELTEKEKTSMVNDSAPAKNISDLYNGKYYFGNAKED